ncbi:MAG: winged helix-turn-helix domain-containing protein [Thaumarchaeota archaeon]|nr:winged helix-turn-helix domain-containing protein [Nitrososphaerota archaeon]
MGEEDADARRLAKVIDHPIRARIIDLLGEKGSLGWKELSTELGVKTGALYHHLDTLEGLVERDSSKKYSLTKSGRIVYSRTSESHTMAAVQKAAIDMRREGAGRRLAVSIFAPRSLLSYLTSSTNSAALVATTAGVALAVLSIWAGISPRLYFLRPGPGIISTVGGFTASLAALIILGYASTKLAFKSEVDLASLAAGASISFLPVFAVSFLTIIPQTSALLASSSIAYTLLLVFFQTWSSTLFGAGLSVASGVRIERTLVVSILILYATMIFMLLQGSLP